MELKSCLMSIQLLLNGFISFYDGNIFVSLQIVSNIAYKSKIVLFWCKNSLISNNSSNVKNKSSIKMTNLILWIIIISEEKTKVF